MLAKIDKSWLTPEQEEDIIQHFDALNDYDKIRSKFPQRAKPTLTQGKFKAKRTSTVTAGQETTER